MNTSTTGQYNFECRKGWAKTWSCIVRIQGRQWAQLIDYMDDMVMKSDMQLDMSFTTKTVLNELTHKWRACYVQIQVSWWCQGILAQSSQLHKEQSAIEWPCSLYRMPGS